ncbi:N-acetylmuramoyl-L-alanine amidase [Allokutzneria oryzae]|uniref:N-acetylmuramoyl-L-alanine amidase n=1 Tax=Allokutzneria oryzae TaxID=1378989 RepID=A0ABV5ZUN1_9PSEU
MEIELSRRTLLRGVASAGLVVGAGLYAATPALAVPAPSIASCSTWGARPAKSTPQLLDHKPTVLIVHQTEGPNSTDHSKAHAYSMARSIQNHHMDSNRWIDSGQQFTISRGGHVLEGRHRSLSALKGGKQHVLGAHVGGHNDTHIGIENEGTYHTVTPPDQLWASLVTMCAYICQQYGIKVSNIKGHRDYNDTDCPGNKLYSMLPKLRQEVAQKLG